MATLTTALNTSFEPAVGQFVAQCSNGQVSLERRGTSGAAWVSVGFITPNSAPVIDNPVAGCQYRFVAVSGSPVVQADQ